MKFINKVIITVNIESTKKMLMLFHLLLQSSVLVKTPVRVLAHKTFYYSSESKLLHAKIRQEAMLISHP